MVRSLFPTPIVATVPCRKQINAVRPKHPKDLYAISQAFMDPRMATTLSMDLTMDRDYAQRDCERPVFCDGWVPVSRLIAW